MESHPAAMHGVQTHDVDFPEGQFQAMFAAADAPGLGIERALRPYRLQVTPGPAGVRIAGDGVAVTLAHEMLDRIARTLAAGAHLDEALVATTARTVVDNALRHDLAFRLTGLRHPVRPLSLSQVAFLDTLLYSGRPLIFGVGPTGTGKTHLAVAAGLTLVAEERFKSLVITRPHERLAGEIITPEVRAETAADDQLTPITDVLRDLVGHDEIKRLMEGGMLDIVPLGRLRGRTFNDSFVIIDDAHNMSVRKMRMAVTRIGRNARMVVTGDPSQSELPSDEPSGLAHLLGLLAPTDLALVHRFNSREIVRNDLVARIEALYENDKGAGLAAAA